METPYQRNGCSQYGAQMGRRSDPPMDYTGERLRLRRVPLNSGGYDPGGAYWGTGGPLWCAWSDGFEFYTRASSREGAKAGLAGYVKPYATPKFYR